MNTSLGKRLLSILLVAVMVLGMVPVLGTPKVEAATNYVSTENLIRGLPYPAGRLETSLSSNMNGLWLIMSSVVRGGDGSTAGTFGYVLDPHRPESGEASFPDGYDPATHSAGYVGYAVRPASTDDINRAQPLGRDYYTKIAGNMGTCTFQTMDGRYWVFEGISGNTKWTALRLKTWSYNFTITSASNGLYRINNGIHYINSNSWTFRGNRESTSEAVKNPQRLFRFYRVSEEMLALRDTLQEALVYVVDNSTGRFNQEKHTAYLDLLCSAANDYTSINSARAGSMVTTADKQKIEEDKKKILNAMAELKLSDTMENQPYDVVLDYGKPIEVDLSGIQSTISKRSGTSLQYVGSLFTGEQGQIQETIPEGLTYNAAGQSYETDMGIFSMTTDRILRYTPKTFMDRAETFYAVHKIATTSDPNYVGYLLTKVQLLPATRVYYEAEDFTGQIAYIQKTTDKAGFVTKDETWETEGNSLNTMQTATPTDKDLVIPDYSDRKDVLFFSFDDTDADDKRYELPQYKGTHFDQSTWSGGSAKFVNTTTISNGVLTIVPKVNVPQTEYVDTNGKPGSGSVSLHPDCSKDGKMFSDQTQKALNYDSSGAEVFQIRFKMKNLDTRIDENNNKTTPYFGLHIWCTDKNGQPFKNSKGIEDAARCVETYNYDPSLLNADEFVTWTFHLGNQFANVGTIWGVRAYFGNTFGSLEGKEGYLKVDYMYMGPADMAPYRESYGYDPSYEEVTQLSNGASLYTEGNGVPTPAVPDPANYTQAKFSFTGTGFDIISRTGEDQATIRVEIFDKEGCTQNDLVVSATVNLKGEKEMYQIPVYSKENLPYGTYWVKVSVNDEINYPALPQLSRGNQFYFDGLIIYDPVDPNTDPQVLSAYKADGEAYPITKELRDILLTGPDFNALDKNVNGTVNGAVFVDYESVPKVTVPAIDEDGNHTGATEDVTDGSLSITNHVTSDVVTYDKVGPKNEVYLGLQQAVAFKLVVYSQELPHRIDVGCKAIMESGGILDIETANAEGRSTGIYSRPLSGGSVRYFSLPLCKEVFAEETIDGKPCYTTYIMIRNKASTNQASQDAVLSITDIKVAYTQEPNPRDMRNDSGAGAASGAELLSLRENTGNSSVELPTDEFKPIGFVVDGLILDVVDSLLQEYDTVEEESAEAEVADLAFAGASVSLQSDLAINYKVNESFFTEMGYHDPYVVIEDNGMQVILRDYEVKDGKYAFIYRNIAPHRIGDTVTATLYAYYGDTLYCSESKDYSVADYCYNMLGKTAGIDSYAKLRTLLVDILLYGAKTQEYMSYRLDSLCTGRLTEEQLACGTAECRELENHRDQAYETIENPEVQWKGAGLNLRESVAIRFKIEAKSYEDLVVKITVAGKTYSIYAKDFDHREDGTYVHFKTINAAQMSEPVYATVYRDGQQVSHTICYSIESYAYSKQNDSTIPHLADLVKRMMCYGDSTKAYVEQ